jgi:hypothetical protein
VRLRLVILVLIIGCEASSQTLGGNAVFNFLKLPNTTQLSALGGINVSNTSNDVGLAFNNPALLQPAMHTQVNAVFNGFYDGMSAYHLSMGYHHEPTSTELLWGLTYLNYGNIRETDASGNIYGNLRPTDWVFQLSGARSYLHKWKYGATLKYIHSNYGQYRSNGLAVDVGILFNDTSNLFSASILAKNMGTQLKKYTGTEADDLPFDLQLGITRRLRNSPLGFSLTAHHLHQFDISYHDAAFNEENGFRNSDRKFSFDKLFRHFVLATTLSLGDKVEIAAGYNHLKRKELNVAATGNGLNGFSLGVSLLLAKLQIRYARAHYQNNTAYNQFGLNMTLNKYFGLGKWGEKIGW